MQAVGLLAVRRRWAVRLQAGQGNYRPLSSWRPVGGRRGRGLLRREKPKLPLAVVASLAVAFKH